MDDMSAPRDYSQGWRDGCAYAERLSRWTARLQGFFAGFIAAGAIVAALLYFGGPQ